MLLCLRCCQKPDMNASENVREQAASTGASIISKFAHATSSTNVPNIPARHHKTMRTRAHFATMSHTRPSLPLHNSLLPSLVKLQARTEPLHVTLPMLLRVAAFSRVTTPWFPGKRRRENAGVWRGSVTWQRKGISCRRDGNGVNCFVVTANYSVNLSRENENK